MVIETKKIPRKDLVKTLSKDGYKRRFFFNYFAEKHDTGEYSIRRKSNMIYHILAIILFIPSFLYYFIYENFKLIRTIFTDLVDGLREDVRFCNSAARNYFEKD